MSNTVIKVENLSKQYRLGEVGTGTLKDDFKRWRYRMMGKEDPFMTVGDVNDRTKKSNADYVWALKDINFEVKQGEVLGIIGKNGAGKSTLLKILSRTTGPTTGSLKMKGRVASLLEVGTGFHRELSGRENIFLNGAILGMSKNEIRSKFDEIVDFAGVERYIDTPVKRYSSGMYVRLAFGVAAHLEPEILIVDEVLAVGDAEFQKKAIGKLKDVSTGGGRTVLYVSHQLESVSNLCTRAILLHNGNILEEGNTEDIISTYLAHKPGNGSEKIETRKDNRSGEGGLKFQDAWFENKNGERVLSFRTGDWIKFVMKVKRENPYINVKNISLGFAINSVKNVAVTDVGTLFSGFQLSDPINNQIQVECVIPKWPLNRGGYTFNVIARNGTTIEDWIVEAGHIDVEPGDYYGSGFVPDEGRLMYMDHKWNMYGAI